MQAYHMNQDHLIHEEASSIHVYYCFHLFGKRALQFYMIEVKDPFSACILIDYYVAMKESDSYRWPSSLD